MVEQTAARGRVLPILKEGDPILRQRAKPVRHVNRKLRELLDDMAATMYAADGVGLAAPQVGVGLRVVCLDVGDGLVELVNPEIKAMEGEQEGYEGCLSVPGLIGEVPRAALVRVTGLDRNGRQVWVEGEELLARAIQHEIDHLDGVLFLDRARRVVPVRPETRLRLVFVGTSDFALPVLDALADAGCRITGVVTRPDRPAGRGLKTRPSPVKVAAGAYELPVLEPTDLRAPEFLGNLRAWRPDCLVVAAYGRILPEEVLALAPRGCLNVHPSLLPRHRGPAPIRRALMEGDSETGVSIIALSREVDAGDIYAQEPVAISAEDDAETLGRRLAETGGRLLLRVLADLAEGRAVATPQDHGAATYAPPLTANDEWIDWKEPAERVAGRVRGLAPRPGARTVRPGGRRLKLFRPRVVPDVPQGAPGEVLVGGAEQLVIATGRGAVAFEVVQPEGRPPMPVRDYLNGHPVAAGEVWG